ncbi:MAG: hypothetical protein L0G39_14975 [Chryseobacterium sp.]|nr:hypothetical protein [Chryseobacterium sp.]
MNNNIILTDDDKEFTAVFINEAAAKKINVAPKESLEGLKKILPKFAHKYAAVVLDIKCLLEDGQVKENATFIGAALTYLDSTVPGFPRFILTGDESEFEGVKKYHAGEKMFLKTPEDKEKLFKELEFCIKNAEPMRLRRENPDVFEAFDLRKLTPAKEQLLVSILLKYNEKDPSNFKGILGDIRELHEEIYKCINSRNKTVVPDHFLDYNKSPNFTTAFYKHLEGNPDPVNKYLPKDTPYQDSSIQSITRFIHNSCSEYLHKSSKTNYQISTYTINAAINGIMEIILWSKQY